MSAAMNLTPSPSPNKGMGIESDADYQAARERMEALNAAIEQIELGMRPSFDELAGKANGLMAAAKSPERYEEVRGRYWKAYQKLLTVQMARSQRAIDEYRRLFIQCQSWERMQND